jgi:N-acetylglutamate synthase-like GNAT family acetyltransferase
MTLPNQPKLTSELEFKEWNESNFRAVNKFYKSQKHKGSASAQERVFVVQKSRQNTSESKIIAAVRLVPYQDYYWLRSLYVEKSLQGNNIGSQLLFFVNQNIRQTIHCFPYAHLKVFYQLCDYSLTELNDLPQALQQLYQRYSIKSNGILIMSQI